ncbi:MAG: hypothetical protein J6K55_04200 [Clostridia bacterium]|nr:hypothetical protein [Clostridia bacterium]
MEKCYPANRNTPLAVAGYILLAAGILILFVCIPRWAWLALLGVGLIALGWIVLRLSNAGR